MRIFLRDNIIEVLGTILDGIRFAAANKGQAAVLDDCRQALASIESALSAELSSDRSVFYNAQISALVEKISKIDTDEQAAGLAEEAIAALCAELENESEVKLEVAFFPYKASMWDSLESVWLAAKADPRCNAVVVPIPYYDKKPNGTLGTMYYEGADFPDYVPIVSYKDYMPENMCPEVAYIHNPYDNNNLVTSVHPAFHSHELKKYILYLVYIPYYVNMWPSNAEFSYVAALGAVDVIVAMSENDAKAYLSHGTGKDVPVLGSPKLDRVLRYEAEKPDIPVEWASVLKGKKVFLLLTTVNSILHSDDSGSKLKRILNLFDKRDDAALFWRPHPLEAATLKAMRPEQFAAYNELFKLAEESSSCVVDRSSDVERAIALSDALIGSGVSSVSYMFKVTGKPTYIVDFDSAEVFTDKDYDEALSAEYMTAPALDGDYLWGACANFNGLARVDIRDGSMEYIGEFPGEYEMVTALYAKTVKVNSKLIFSPQRAGAFAEYDIESGEFRMIPLPEKALAGKGKMNFGGVIDYEDFLLFIPVRSRAFVRYRKSTGEYEYFYDWYEKFEKYITHLEHSFFSSAFLDENKLYLGSLQSNIISTLNLDSMSFDITQIGKAHYRYHGIVKNGKHFWLTRYISDEFLDKNDSVLRWDSASGRIKEFNGFPGEFEMYKLCHTHFAGILDRDKYLIALPFRGNMLVKIDKTTGRMSKYEPGLDEEFQKRASAVFNKWGTFTQGYLDIDNEIWYLNMLYDYSFVKIDLQTETSERYPQRFTGTAHEKAAKDIRRFVYNHIYAENALFQPEDFVASCLENRIPAYSKEQADYYLSYVENADGTCGQNVHDYVINSIIAEE